MMRILIISAATGAAPSRAPLAPPKRPPPAPPRSYPQSEVKTVLTLMDVVPSAAVAADAFEEPILVECSAAAIEEPAVDVAVVIPESTPPSSGPSPGDGCLYCGADVPSLDDPRLCAVALGRYCSLQ